MNSALLKLNYKDLSKGVTIVVLGVVLGAVQQGLSVHGLDFMAYDWAGILELSLKAAGLYLTKNLLSDDQGKVGGVIG